MKWPWTLSFTLLLCIHLVNGEKRSVLTGWSDGGQDETGQSVELGSDETGQNDIVRTESKNGTIEEKTNLESLLDGRAALEGMYKMSRRFVAMLAPKEEILDEILLYVDGNKTFELPKDALDIIKAEAGFMTCLVFGLLLFVGLGVGGTCFCCCRCCCDGCGAKRVQNVKDNINTRRKTYFFLLFIAVIFMTVSVIMCYLVSAVLTDSIPETGKNMDTVLGDINGFLDNTYQELDQLSDKDLTDATNLIKENLTNIGNELGGPVKEACQPNEKMQEYAAPMDKVVDAAIGGQQLLQSISLTLKEHQEELKDITQKLKEIGCRACVKAPPELKIINETEMGTIPSDKVLETVNNKCNEIPSIIENKTENGVKEVKEDIDKMISDIKKSSFRETIKSNYEAATKDISNVKSDVDKFFKEVNDNSGYRWYALAGVVSLLTVPTVLLFLGMCCGLCGHRKARHPSDRGDLSHCGGCTIIVAVYLLFFITGIPILITTIAFQFGAHLETYVCSPLYEENMSTLDKIFNTLKKQAKFEGGYFEKLVPSSTFRDCRNDSTMYKAFNLEKVINISEYFDIMNKLDFVDQIENFKVNVDKEFETVKDKIQQTTGDITSMKTTIQKLSDKIKDDFIDAKAFSDWISGLERETNSLAEDEKKKLSEQIERLKKINTTLPELSKSRDTLKKKLDEIVKSDLQDSGTKLQTETNNMMEQLNNKINEEKKKYAKRLTQMVKDYIENVKIKLETKIGKCKPIWVIYDVTRKILCRDVLDPINGYWFSMGWGLFFSIFAIAFGTKLSKHYLRMTRMKTRKWDENAQPRDISGHTNMALQEFPSSHRGHNDYEDYPHNGGPPPPYGPPQDPHRHSYGPLRQNYGPPQGSHRKNYGPPSPRYDPHQERSERWSKY